MQNQHCQEKPGFNGTLARAAALSTIIGLTAIGCASKSISRKNPMLESISTIGKLNPSNSKMSIVDFTGHIQIKLRDGSTIGIVPGAHVPEIPSDAKVIVVSGWAQFEIGNTYIHASSGNSFFFKVKRNSFKIKTTDTSEIKLSTGKKETILMPGKTAIIKFDEGSDELGRSKEQQQTKANTVNMEILGFAGQISVKLQDGSIIGIASGAPTVTIPPNSQVHVNSKFAVFGAGGMVVGADGGESFLYDSEGTSTGIRVLKADRYISIAVGKGNEIKLEQGEFVVVKPEGSDEAVIVIVRKDANVERKVVKAPGINSVFE